MYRTQKKLVPWVTGYLGVYSIRSRLSHSIKQNQTLDHAIPPAVNTGEQGCAEEDPFPNSTRPYGKRLETSNSYQQLAGSNSQLSYPFDASCAAKETTILGQSMPSIEPAVESKRYSGFVVHFQHVYALVKRYLLIKMRDINRLANLTYFPLADIVVAGLVSNWMTRNSPNALEDQILYLLELAFWIIINAAHIESCFNLIEEIQTRNFVNLFSSSLQHFEWITASFILSCIESVLMTAVSSLFVYEFYGIHLVASVGWFLPLFLILMVMAGWVMAVFTISLMVHFGLRMTIIVMALPYIVMSMSAAFYPVHVLPGWLQAIASFLPTTYIFEGLRVLVTDHLIPTKCLALSLILNILYMVFALFFYNFMFKKSREQGLARLEAE